MRVWIVIFLPIVFGCTNKSQQHRNELADEIENSLRNESLAKWYPQAMDTVYGGFLSTFTFDFKPTGDQDKMIVTQARHTWTNAKAFIRYPHVGYYREGTAHGFKFLKDAMW